MPDKQMNLDVADHQPPRAFFAYASDPFAQGEAIQEAALRINKTQTVNIQTWEDLRVTGRP